MNLKKIGKVFTSKFVGTGPSSYEKRIYRAAVSQRLRNTDLVGLVFLRELGYFPLIIFPPMIRYQGCTGRPGTYILYDST